MKKFSKTLLSVAAVTAVSAAMAISAMAADDFTAKYADGTLTLTGVATSGASQTILVLTEQGNTDGVTSENANNVVKQIDQDDTGVAFTSVPVGELVDGTYYVRIGGSNGTLQTASFTVGGGTVEPETKTIMVGDVDSYAGIDSDDVTALARWTADIKGDQYDNTNIGTTYTVSGDTKTVTIGDVDSYAGVDSDDVTALARWVADIKGADYDNTSVGEEVKVVVEK